MSDDEVENFLDESEEDFLKIMTHQMKKDENHNFDINS
jgi:hypothetical protein